MRLVALLFALLASVFAPAWAQSFPPSPKQLVAVNPITNKVYVANEAANSVTVLDEATNTTRTIPVGNRPQFIVVNPLTNRVFVNNGGEASLTVIDGATDTNLTPTPLAIGSQGPMAINAETNIVYIVRMTSLATDEVTFFNANNNTWYTIATESFQPTALTINPVTNTLYVAHYGTGDVRVISGAFNNTVLHPTTFSIGAWSHPFAIAANWITNKVYVITEDSRGPIGIIDGATNNAVFRLPAAGHGSGPKALAVNPVTNKVYAAFANEVIVISGDGSYTYVPVTTGSTASIAINFFTNQVYVSSDGATLTVIDGFTNATTSLTVPAGTLSIGVNPMTNEIIAAGGTTALVDGVAGVPIGVTPTTTITPLPSNSSGSSATITMNASSGSPTPVRGIYYQLDSVEGAWSPATGAGTGPYTAALTGLSNGSHTIYAFAAEAHIAPTDTGQGSSPLFGSITSYSFTANAGSGTAAVSLASSANPTNVGQSVTFTASVTGSSGTPTGSVTFKDGATTLCSAVALASGSAACTTSALIAGSHTITASYSGNSTYGTASQTLTQTVNKIAAAVSVASSPNPSTPGQSVTITATVTGSGGTPTGTVTFLDGTTTLCSAVTLASGSATCATSALTSTGAHTLNATYSGNGTYNTASGTATQNVGTAASTTTVSSSVNPSLVGQSVTFTAAVTGSGATPTGSVNFTDGATTVCAAVALASGSATCTTTALVAGSHTITATYSGSGTYGGSNGSVSQTVNKRAAAVAVGSTPSPSVWGQAVTITATVTGGGGTPGGSVSFLDGATTLCNAVALSGAGTASCTTSMLSVGAHTLTANYSGSTTYNTGTGSTTQNVSAAPSTTTVTSSVNPSLVGEFVNYTVTVSGSGSTPTGTVTVAEGSTTLCPAMTLSSSGSATCTTDALAAGSHTVTATYSGGGGYNGSSGSVSQTVNKRAASVSVSSTPNPSTAGQSVTITATVAGSGAAPTGSVTFSDGATTLCPSVSLSSGTAACTTSSLPSGSRTITAAYSGNATYGTKSATVTQTVNAAAATPATISSPTNGATLGGDSQTFTWNAAPRATLYQVWVGNAPGTYDIGYYPKAGTSSTSTTVDGLPTDGRTLYVRLWSLIDGVYYSTDSTYVAASPAAGPARITSPANGAVLAGASQLFKWNAARGATLYQVWVGNTPGAYDIGYYPKAGTSSTSTTVDGLPTDGRTLYVRLWSLIDGVYYSTDSTYVAASGAVVEPAHVTSPANGAVLSGASQLFQWNAAPRATLYQVWVGNAPGAYDIGYYPAAGTTSTSTAVNGLPTDGRTLYVRLWSLIDGVYYSTDSTYVAARGP